MKTLVVVSALAALAPAVRGCWPESEGKAIKYSSVPGYFMQDNPATDPNSFDYVNFNFGLLNRTYPTDKRYDPAGTKTQWQRFEYWVEHLNRGCSKNDKVKFKVLLMGRHGEGWHNAAETFYGTPAWNCYWSELDGNGTAIWADPLLTPAGVDQTTKAHAYFKSRFELEKMPAPESYYTSPLSRCTITANLTFAGLDLPPSRPFIPIVKEFLREGISIHTCDRRSNRTYIQNMFPFFRFEKGFTEFDELWRGTEGETGPAQDARSRVFLDELFREDDKTWVSITSHSGEIGRLLGVLNHIPFRLSTGQIIPVLVKAEVVEPVPSTSTFASFTSEATCNAPPVTSIAGTGCVCASTTVPAVLATATA